MGPRIQTFFCYPQGPPVIPKMLTSTCFLPFCVEPLRGEEGGKGRGRVGWGLGSRLAEEEGGQGKRDREHPQPGVLGHPPGSTQRCWHECCSLTQYICCSHKPRLNTVAHFLTVQQLESDRKSSYSSPARISQGMSTVSKPLPVTPPLKIPFAAVLNLLAL